MTPSGPRPRILHLLAASAAEGSGASWAQVIGGLADFDHAVVLDDPGGRAAAGLADQGRKLAWPRFPSLAGRPWPGRLMRIAQAMAGYDLICTYGHGTLDAVMAHTLFADVYKLAPLVHHEDRPTGSTLYRRIALGRVAALIVPTPALEQLALDKWQQPRGRVQRIPDGIATRPFASAPKRDALPQLIKHKGEMWIGALSGASGDPAMLVRAVSRLHPDWQLVVIGDDPAGAAILAEAERCGIEERVHWPGAVADEPRVLGLFDIFVATERASIIRAMAAGRTIVVPGADGLADTVASENAAHLLPAGDSEALDDELWELATDPAQRKLIGEANRARARAEFDTAVMVARYGALYKKLLARK